jgi:hypothetical protein
MEIYPNLFLGGPSDCATGRADFAPNVGKKEPASCRPLLVSGGLLLGCQLEEDDLLFVSPFLDFKCRPRSSHWPLGLDDASETQRLDSRMG